MARIGRKTVAGLLIAGLIITGFAASSYVQSTQKAAEDHTIEVADFSTKHQVLTWTLTFKAKQLGNGSVIVNATSVEQTAVVANGAYKSRSAAVLENEYSPDCTGSCYFGYAEMEGRSFPASVNGETKNRYDWVFADAKPGVKVGQEATATFQVKIEGSHGKVVMYTKGFAYLSRKGVFGTQYQVGEAWTQLDEFQFEKA